jgi:hypothetical protein
MPLTSTWISEILDIVANNGYWGDGERIFKNLGVPEKTRVSGGVRSRARVYLEAAEGAAVDAILRYFETGPYAYECKPWSHRGLKLFISHRDDQKSLLALLRQPLEVYGMTPFLAHEAIEAGTVWREELKKGLSSMDALFAYCSEGFSKSDWTAQEVGYGFGKNVPVIAVMAGENLRGLLEPVQGAKMKINDEASARSLAEHLFDQLKKDDRAKQRLSEGLALELKFAGTFAYARGLAERMIELGEMSKRARQDVQLALQVNEQTSDAKHMDEFMRIAA